MMSGEKLGKASEAATPTPTGVGMSRMVLALGRAQAWQSQSSARSGSQKRRASTNNKKRLSGSGDAALARRQNCLKKQWGYFNMAENHKPGTLEHLLKILAELDSGHLSREDGGAQGQEQKAKRKCMAKLGKAKGREAPGTGQKKLLAQTPKAGNLQRRT